MSKSKKKNSKQTSSAIAMPRSEYCMRILGIIAKTSGNVLFNILVLLFGFALGMGFTVMHVQHAWDRSSYKDMQKQLNEAVEACNAVDQIARDLLDAEISVLLIDADEDAK